MLKRINLTGNPNLGVYISVTDDVAIVPPNFPENMENAIIEVLDIELIKTTIAASNLAGALAVGNSNGLIVSPQTSDKEIALLKDYGVDNIGRIEDRYSAVGNIVAANDVGAICSPFLGKTSIETIKDTLDVQVISHSIAGYDIIGSLLAVTNKGFLIHKDASEDEIQMAKNIFSVEGDVGTVGRGISLIGACSISNSNGVIVAENTTGPEMARIEEALGFLDF